VLVDLVVAEKREEADVFLIGRRSNVRDRWLSAAEEEEDDEPGPDARS
jgi:hypothetical protein